LVSSKVGILVIGIGIIAVILLAPREILTPERVMRFAEKLKRPEQTVTNGTTNGLPTNGVTTMVSPKPVSEKLTTQITTTIPTQTPTIIQPKAIPIPTPIDPTVTTPEERALVESEIARLKAEAGTQFVTTDPTGKKTFNVFLTERL